MFLLSWILVNNHSQWFYQTAYRIEGAVRRTAQQINGQTDSFSDGVISRGNIYPSGNVQMELWADQLPEETLYLRNFSGGSYENGRWLAAEEEELFLRMAETLHWEQWSDWIPNMYNVLYFLMNLYSGGSETEAHMMQIRYLSEDGQENPYFPYYSRVSQWHGREEGNMSTVWYFNQGEMNIRWDQVPDVFSATRNWYYAIQETYLQEAQSVYTELPEGELPRLTELCRENPQEDLSHITAFILYTLQSQASYTRTPGLYPVNQDPTEYFLFESGEGYCQHFTSAAALMYCLYGIPARYAAGYAVSPSDFEQQENGRYYAAVTDESAHAWVEIFLEDLGWTPVEVTPPANNAQISYPMMTQEELEGILGNQNWNLEIFQALPREQEAEEAEAGNDFDLLPKGFSFSLEGTETGKLLWGMFLASAVFALAWQNQHRKKERREIPELFARLVKALHFAGYLRDYTGTERNFPAQLKQLFPELPESQTEEAVRIAWKAAFGESPLSPGEEKEFRDYYIQAAEELGGRQNPLRRLILRYRIMGARL